MDKRTHSCGALRVECAEQQVVLMGWVRTLRDHGGIVFLDLWDREGTTQIVVDPLLSQSAYEVAQNLHPEFVVAVRGTVKARPNDAINQHLVTGEIEVAAVHITVLNTAKPLPFPLEEHGRQDELGLRYRYLDLRRDKGLANLRLRHNVVKTLRDTLNDTGFLDIETPILGASTPEGARDYLVPSRVHAGSFYALPQSPQQMKQLLMVAGVDKYYQIARCFRDEARRPPTGIHPIGSGDEFCIAGGYLATRRGCGGRGCAGNRTTYARASTLPTDDVRPGDGDVRQRQA